MEFVWKNYVKEVWIKIDVILVSLGLIIGEVYLMCGGKSVKGLKVVVVLKYCNFDNVVQTWLGCGKCLVWFIDVLKKKGVIFESLLIVGVMVKVVFVKKVVKKVLVKKVVKK